MKRIKIMLLTICLVAIAGGILAFKTLNPQRFCTAATTTNPQGQVICPNLCPNNANPILTDVGNLICTAPTTVGTNGQTSCTYTTDPPGPVTLTTVTQSCQGQTQTTAIEN